MQALLWRDYLCPWCYLGRDRTALLRRLGVEVTALGYELHPEVPEDGRAIRPGGRYDRVLDRIGAELAELGIPFSKPTRTPNTRRVLEVAEILRLRRPAAFAAFDDAAYRTHWVDGRDLTDPAVIDDLLADVGADPTEIEGLRAAGVGRTALEESMAAARDRGVTATPAWLVDDRLLIPGAQPRETIERWVTKLMSRAER